MRVASLDGTLDRVAGRRRLSVAGKPNGLPAEPPGASRGGLSPSAAEAAGLMGSVDMPGSPARGTFLHS
jgi:hypothetical protein